MSGFIKIMRDDIEYLATEDPKLLCMLMLLAARASWKDNARTGLSVGDAMMGHSDFPHWTKSVYRATLKRLKRDTYATYRTTYRGTIVSLQGYGFADFADPSATPPAFAERPESDPQATPNEEEKRTRTKKKKKKDPVESFHLTVFPKAVNKELWSEYILDTRTNCEKPGSKSSRALKTLSNQIEKLASENGCTVDDIVDQSVSNGWKLCYPLKETKNDRLRTATDIARDSSWSDGLEPPDKSRGRAVRIAAAGVSELLPR